jgi:glycosyltransferase involved in cell wall biosynthesis
MESKINSHTKEDIFILTNTLKSGGAEKQSIYLTKALSSHYNVILIVYYGDYYDSRMLDLLDGYKDRVIWLNGSHPSKLWFLHQLFHRNKNGIVISYLATTNLINAIVGKLAGTRIRIGGIRNSKLSPFKLIIQKFFHNYLLTCTVVNNKRGIRELTSRGFKADKIILIHNGIATKQIEKEHRSPDTITILTVGRFVAQKDYKTAITAFREVAKITMPKQKIKYIIIGHGIPGNCWPIRYTAHEKTARP